MMTEGEACVLEHIECFIIRKFWFLVARCAWRCAIVLQKFRFDVACIAQLTLSMLT